MSGILSTIQSINGAISNVVWGPIMLTLLIGTGLLLSIRMGFPQFTKFGYAMKHTIGGLFSGKQRTADESGVSPFQAVATAMAGTIGTGSITGVATALVSGGPGAIFWMWVSALLGMVTKYSEIVLSLTYREKNDQGQWAGGPMYYIQNGLGMKWLAMIFAFFVAIACLGTGNATQGNSISMALESTLGINPLITGVVLTVLVGAIILGGIRRIATITEKLVPFMAVFYVVVAIVALVLNAPAIPDAFATIISEAFSFQSAAGGAAGYSIMMAMRYGFARGVYSNEAGLGSAPIAHASSSTKEPVEQGLWGMFEVFFTTIIICTCTAMVIMTSGALDTGLSGSALSIAAYNRVIPGVGGLCVTLGTVLFATSTILGWAYYGEKAIEYLSNKNKTAVTAYRVLYIVVVFIGCASGSGNLDLIWGISDTSNGLMAIPNLIGIVGLSGVVVKATKNYFSRIGK
ncbi:MAG: alanine:cation symporter family protein [Peptococcaceae bacterium]|nr:alanine:cation symporter family protein [Peptococcaceae bacterium]